MQFSVIKRNEAMVMKTVWYRGEGRRQIDQQDRTESPEIDPDKYSQLIFDKEAKVKQWRKNSLFNEWFWNNWTLT